MTEQQITPTDSVDRIRDIIFGPKMRDYDNRFDVLLRDLARLQDEVNRLNELLAAQEAAQGRQLQGVRQEFRQSAEDQQRALAAELSQLGGQMTADTTAQLQAQRQELQAAFTERQDALRAEHNRLSERVAEQETAQTQSLQNLRQELRKADSELRDELRQISQRLHLDKVERSVLGDLFVELGNHVKSGGSLSELLQNLDQSG